MLPDNQVTISVIIDKEVKELLDKYSKEIDLSTSRFARNLIYIGLDDFKLLKKIGIIRTCLAFRTLLDTIRKK
jgi:hypothetical protein